MKMCGDDGFRVKRVYYKNKETKIQGESGH